MPYSYFISTHLVSVPEDIDYWYDESIITSTLSSKYSGLSTVPEDIDYWYDESRTGNLSYQLSPQMAVRANSPIDSAASTTTEHERNRVWSETESSSTMPKVPEGIDYRDAESSFDSTGSSSTEHEQNCFGECSSTMPKVPIEILYCDDESVTSTLSYLRLFSLDSAGSTTSEHERNCFWAETKSSNTMPKVPLRRSVRNGNDTVAKAPLWRGRRWRTVCNSNDTVPKAPLRRRGLSEDF
jgi:hypothetical protein